MGFINQHSSSKMDTRQPSTTLLFFVPKTSQIETSKKRTLRAKPDSELRWSGKIDTVKKRHGFSDSLWTNKKDSSLNQTFRFLFDDEIFKLCIKTTSTFRLMKYFTLLITWKYSILSSSGKSSNPYARSSQDSNSSAKVFHLRQYATTSSNILCTHRSSIDTFFQRSPVSRIKRSMLTLSRWSEIHVTYPLSVINNNVSCRKQIYLLYFCVEHGHILWYRYFYSYLYNENKLRYEMSVYIFFPVFTFSCHAG